MQMKCSSGSGRASGELTGSRGGAVTSGGRVIGSLRCESRYERASSGDQMASAKSQPSGAFSGGETI